MKSPNQLHTNTGANKVISDIPDWIVLTQCLLFAILYAIWAQPGTILIRHVCLILGSLIGLYEIYVYRHLIFTKQAIPVWIITTLFAWISFHLFYLGQDFTLQLIEFKGVWKRTAFGFVFALGLGLALRDKPQKYFWWLIFGGCVAPSFIYFVKYFFTYYSPTFNIISPEWLILYDKSAPFYIPKTTYVVFCLPALSISLGQIYRNILLKNWLIFDNFIYIFSATLAVLVFYNEGILNGKVYSAIIFFIFTILIVHENIKALTKQTKITILLIVIILFSALSSSRINEQGYSQKINNLYADFKLAITPDTHYEWKTFVASGLPINENGVKANDKYFIRLSWAYNGLRLVKLHPLGYGLIENSFGRLGAIEWPNSDLTQSHSGWIDLTLGIGIPGTLLVLLALCFIIFFSAKTCSNFWGVFSCSYILALALLWTTTEVSQRVYFDSLIFVMALTSGLSMIGIRRSQIGTLSGKGNW